MHTITAATSVARILKKSVFEACRCSGPGGQSVNTSNSKAVMRVPKSAIHAAVGAMLPFRTSKDSFIVTSQQERTFALNQNRCIEKLSKHLQWAERVIQARAATPSAEQQSLVDKHRRAFKEANRVEKRHLQAKKADRQKAKADIL